MSKISLDLSQFKHVCSDDESTTLRHRDGHELKMAHGGLTSEARKQLEALAASAKKPLDKGEARQEKQTGSGTVYVDNTAKGLEQAKTIHKEKAAPHGAVVVVEPKKKMAEGGDPKFASPDQAKDMKKVYGDTSTQDESILDRVKHSFDDPKATPTPSPKYADGGKIDRQMYAEAGAVEQADPTKLRSEMPQEAQPQVQEQLQAPQSPEIDADTARKRELYNSYTTGDPLVSGDLVPGAVKSTQFGPKGEQPKNFDANSWGLAERDFAAEKADNAAKAAATQQQIIKDNQARAAAGLPLKQVPDVPSEGQAPGSDMNPAQQRPDQLPQQAVKQVDNPQGISGSGDLGDIEGMMKSGYNEKLSGITKQAEAQGKLGEEQALALNNQVKAQTDAQAVYQKSFKELEQERQAHMADIQAGHIDPNKYWTGDLSTGMGGHSKIAAGIGMILAGFNPTSNPNAAINFLKFNMEQNLEAQRQNLGSKQNLLAANLRQFGNVRDAMDMTRLMQHDIMQNELMSAAAKAQSPQAKAAALQAMGQLKMDSAPVFQNFAMRRAMMKLANGQGGDPSNTAAAEQMIAYARMTNPEMAKEMESRLIPGVGMAKVPVPPAAREEMIAKQSLNNAAQDLMEYSKKHTNLVPGSADYNFGVTKAMAFQQKIREGLLGTVFRESEKPLLEKFVGENPAGALKALSTQPKLKAIMESNIMGLNAQKQGYGLPVQQAGPQIKIVNGVKYMRGPKGEAIPVK